MGKNLSNKYNQKLLDTAKKSTTDAIKTASKRAIQKTTEATGDLIGNKIADKIMSVSTELHLEKSTKNYQMMKQKQMWKELLLRKDTYHQKKDKKLLMN